MSIVSAATIGSVPESVITQALHRCLFPRQDRPWTNFRANFSRLRLQVGGNSHAAVRASAVPASRDRVRRHLPLLSGRPVRAAGEPGPSVDFAFFREPLRRDAALLDKWTAAAQAGSRSEAWAHFLDDIGERFFKGSRKQRVMDALILSLDILPERRRADALACLLADGIEGRAAAEEFWNYIGMARIPEADRARVTALLRQYEIGM